jgi:hypothetical protein
MLSGLDRVLVIALALEKRPIVSEEHMAMMTLTCMAADAS